MGLVVVKVGGALIDQPGARTALATGIAALRAAGETVVLVHGGGPQLDAAAARLGLPTERVAGRRVTSAALLDAAVAEWRGRLSLAWVLALAEHGVSAVGLCGVDGGLLEARRRPPVRVQTDHSGAVEVDYGEVGDVVCVRAGVLHAVLRGGLVPVVAPLAWGGTGALNVNADTVAAELAVALFARRLVLCTSAPGILADPSDPASAYAELDMAGLDRLEAAGALQGGMRPKAAAVRRALQGGVAEVAVVDGGGGPSGPGTRVVEGVSPARCGRPHGCRGPARAATSPHAPETGRPRRS